MLFFNYAGLIMCVIGFAAAFGLGALVGESAEGPLMILGGPLIAALDLFYRSQTRDGHWCIPHRGGSLFFLPAWVLGIVWFVLGIVYTLRGDA